MHYINSIYFRIIGNNVINTMAIEIKTKSISVQDLGNIVKQMINGALENTEEMAKLHSAVCEESFFEKMRYINTKSREPEIIKFIEKDVSATVAHRRMCKPKYKRYINLTYIQSNNSLKIEEPVNIWSCTTLQKLKSGDRSKTLIKEDTKIHSIFETPKENFLKNSDRDLENQYVKLKTCSVSSNAEKQSEENMMLKVYKNDGGEPKLKKKVKSINKQCKKIEEHFRTLMKKQVNNGLSFEEWKKQKTLVYKNLFQEKEKKQQQDLKILVAEKEYKKTKQEARIHVRNCKLTDQKVKLAKKQIGIVKQINAEACKKRINEKQIINTNGVKEWKKRKNMKLNEQKKMKNENYSYQFQPKQLISALKGNIEFDFWLNQLDWILHEKYLRERRYLVRSVYCQPRYYGIVAMHTG